ncbi:MAG: PKD domain-containing protein, partial [Flavobacteriales bacterium]
AIGYAYLGGPYTQILWRANGWSSSQINRVYGHEVGHIFHAFDEYSSSTSSNCVRSFNGRVNGNYQGAPCSGSTACVMVDNSFSGSGATRRWNLCTHTPYHLGWQGAVTPASFVSPVNDVVVTQNPVVLRFQRTSPPANVNTYVKVFERNTGNEVYCGTVASTVDTLALSLVNGQYRWSAGLGIASDVSGYAGVVVDSAAFVVNAPLNADFSRTPAVLCAGSSVVFTDHSTGAPNAWTWSFPGGTPNSWTGQDPPAIVYSAPGVYSASLLVGDGQTTDGFTWTNAITVTGGLALPFTEAFTSGTFPPADWTMQGGIGGQGGIGWQTTSTGSCGQGVSAWVDGFGFSGTFGYTVLRSPYLDLINTPDPYLRFRHSYARESATETESFHVSAHDCTYGFSQEVTTTPFQTWTNDGSFVTGQPWVPANCGDWRVDLYALPAATGHLAQFEFQLQTQGGQNFYLDDVRVFAGNRLNLRVLLEGPYDPQTQLMRDDLRVAGLVPLAEPFTGMGYFFKGEGGGETINASVLQTTGSNAIVDWLLVEVRDPVTPTQILTARAALLQRDGDVVDLDGISLVRVGVASGSYHIALRHRNHLGVMTANPIAVSTGMAQVDFSSSGTLTYGTDARKASGGKQLLWMGDVVWDHSLKYIGTNNDRDPILVRIGGVLPTATVLGYYNEDATLDGVVKYVGGANDRDPILVNIGGTIPTAVRVEQLP